MRHNLNPQAIKSEIINIKNIEKYNAIKSDNLSRHLTKWHGIEPLGQNGTEIRDNVVAEYIDQMSL